jgi:ATP-binding cassette, subfamily G (WHITE), member 2, SNQ2
MSALLESLSRCCGLRSKDVISSNQFAERKPLIKGLTGYVQPGEMVLVLGRPGSGCTTFLRTVSDTMDKSCEISGDVLYGTAMSRSLPKSLSGSAIFSAADDVHISTLNVNQTLRFALKAKPLATDDGTRKRDDLREQVLRDLLKMFNISHVGGTFIGNAQLRGISGGERKRVSIAEALIARPSICCWDNSTLGLDAGSAADYVKSLRVLTNVYEMTTFASLYQASDNLYQYFDKVLILENGYELYFGPASSARPYFEDLGYTHAPGQSTVEFLADCADHRLKIRSVHDGPESLAKSFQASQMYSKLVRQMSEFQSQCVRRISSQAAKGIQHSDKRRKGPHVWREIRILVRRHATLRLQDRVGLIVKNTTSIVVAILCGTIYWQLPKTSSGAFTRGGILFIALLYNAFTAFAELPLTIMGRPVLQKHRSFGFYRPSSLFLAQILVDVPLAAFEVCELLLAQVIMSL